MADSKNLEKVADGIKEFLLEKNKRYGNSALEPITIFTKHKTGDRAVDGILERLDDKIMRIKNSNELRKNDTADIIGYLLLLCAAKGWNDFRDLLD
jgi:hypothetical protein